MKGCGSGSITIKYKTLTVVHWLGKFFLKAGPGQGSRVKQGGCDLTYDTSESTPGLATCPWIDFTMISWTTGTNGRTGMNTLLGSRCADYLAELTTGTQ